MTNNKSEFKISIVVATTSKSESYDLFAASIQKNTVNKFELVTIVDGIEVYDSYNRGVMKANNNLVVLVNDDMYFPENWDADLYNIYNEHDNAVVTWHVVEPGYVKVSDKNVHMNFGEHPKEFDENEFLKFIKKNPLDGIQNELGWYQPFAIKKDFFIECGLYPTYPPHPIGANDITFFEVLKDKRAFFLKVPRYVYHFQRLTTDKREQKKSFIRAHLKKIFRGES